MYISFKPDSCGMVAFEGFLQFQYVTSVDGKPCGGFGGILGTSSCSPGEWKNACPLKRQFGKGQQQTASRIPTYVILQALPWGQGDNR